MLYKNKMEVNSQSLNKKILKGDYFNNAPYHSYYQSNPIIDGRDGVRVFTNPSSPIRNDKYAEFPLPRFAMEEEGCGPEKEIKFNLPTVLPYMNKWLQDYSKYTENCNFGYDRKRGGNYYSFRTLDEAYNLDNFDLKLSYPCSSFPIYNCEKSNIKFINQP